MQKETPVFLIHGLGCTPLTLYPLEKYLRWQGYTRLHRLSYPASTLRVEDAVAYVDKSMQAHADKAKEDIILIGQSLGGRIANQLHKYGWRVRFAFYIGSPLHGARLLNQLEAVMPTRIRNWLYKLPYDDLKQAKKDIAPPHPYHTVSAGWLSTSFDGCVYKDETMLDPAHHTHFAWSDHRTIFVDPRLWKHVHDVLVKNET